MEHNVNNFSVRYSHTFVQQLATSPLFNSEHGLISQAIKSLIMQLVARPNASQKIKRFLFLYSSSKSVQDYLSMTFFQGSDTHCLTDCDQLSAFIKSYNLCVISGFSFSRHLKTTNQSFVSTLLCLQQMFLKFLLIFNKYTRSISRNKWYS